jgi:hypothetical protein
VSMPRSTGSEKRSPMPSGPRIAYTSRRAVCKDLESDCMTTQRGTDCKPSSKKLSDAMRKRVDTVIAPVNCKTLKEPQTCEQCVKTLSRIV